MVNEQDSHIKTADSLIKANGRLVKKLLSVVLGMFVFGFALVPIYDIVCEATGLNGKTGRVAAADLTGPDLSREVTVKFISNVNGFAPWEFVPKEATMKVHPGGAYYTSYFAKNKTAKTMVGKATPSVAPREASLYFGKLECFCFTRQVFEPKEGRDMPIRFVVDRALPEHIDTIVLSYTFFDVTSDG